MRQNTRNNFSKGSPILRCACRWPPLTIQPNYSSVMMASKQPPTLLPPTQAQQPDVVELDTGRQEVNAQSLKARLMSQVFFRCYIRESPFNSFCAFVFVSSI